MRTRLRPCEAGGNNLSSGPGHGMRSSTALRNLVKRHSGSIVCMRYAPSVGQSDGRYVCMYVVLLPRNLAWLCRVASEKCVYAGRYAEGHAHRHMHACMHACMHASMDIRIHAYMRT